MRAQRHPESQRETSSQLLSQLASILLLFVELALMRFFLERRCFTFNFGATHRYPKGRNENNMSIKGRRLHLPLPVNNLPPESRN